MTWKSFLFWGAVGFAVYHYTRPPKPFDYPVGLELKNPPGQWNVGRKSFWILDGVKYTPLANFQFDALVLSTARYRFDELSAVSPIDFLLSWGPMAKAENLKGLTFNQYGRWGHVEWVAQPRLRKEEIFSNMANMHMIPANDQVKADLLAVEPGRVISVRGSLVKVDGPNGLTVTSSLSRTDNDAGACEVVWVDQFSYWVPRAVSSTDF